MMIRKLTLFALLLSFIHVAAASDKGLMVAMEVVKDGQSLGKPSIWQQSGTTGEISMQNEFRLKITPTAKDDSADVKFEIFTSQDGVESTAGSPRIVTKIGQPASIAWNASNGKSYKLSILVSQTQQPAR